MALHTQDAFNGFTPEDFDVFQIPGLAPRMEALIARVRPKLHQLGDQLAPTLSMLCGTPIYPHVAKHARRTVHPPVDTWVAYAASKRGYKALPHFQIGMFASQLFIQFAVIYESDNKVVFAGNALEQLDKVKALVPPHYVWSDDHMVPGGTPHAELDREQLVQYFNRIRTVKKAEALCGIIIGRDDPLLQDGPRLLQLAEQTFSTLLPLYRLSFPQR